MAIIQAIFDINKSGNGILESVSSNQITNNVSKVSNSFSAKYDILSMQKNEGHLGIPIYGKISDYIGSKRLLDNNGYNGLMWGKTDSEGNYSIKFSLTGYNLFKLTFYFDDTAEQYPTNYEVTLLDGTVKSFSNETNHSSIEIFFQSGYGEQSVTFKKWTKANYNVSITYIESIPATIIMNKSWIDTFTSEAQKTSNPATIEYGCLSNNGTINLKDKNTNNEDNQGILFTYAKYGYLDSNIFNISIYVNGKEIQYHIPSDSPYYNVDNKIDMTLTNPIAKWNDLTFEDINIITNTTLYYILEQIVMKCYGLSTKADFDNIFDLSTVIKVDNEKDGVYQETSVEDYLKGIYFDTDFVYKGDTLTKAINDICTVAQLNCYADDNGKYKLVNARPIATDNDIKDNNVIEIKYDMQIGSPKSTILVANRYDGVIIK